MTLPVKLLEARLIYFKSRLFNVDGSDPVKKLLLTSSHTSFSSRRMEGLIVDAKPL